MCAFLFFRLLAVTVSSQTKLCLAWNCESQLRLALLMLPISCRPDFPIRAYLGAVREVDFFNDVSVAVVNIDIV